LSDIQLALSGSPLFDLVKLNCDLSYKYRVRLDVFVKTGFLISIPRDVLEQFTLEQKRSALESVGHYINFAGCKKGIEKIFNAACKAATTIAKEYTKDKIEEYALGLIFENKDTIDDIKKMLELL